MMRRYLYSINDIQIVVMELFPPTLRKISAVYFKTIHPSTVPSKIMSNEFSVRTHTPPLAHLTLATPPYSSIGTARRYIDTKEWKHVHKRGIVQLDEQEAI